MSSLTSLYGGGGGGTPVNSIAQLYVGGQTQYTDESGGVWLKTGNTIASDPTTYPDAYQNLGSIAAIYYNSNSIDVNSVAGNTSSVQFNNDGTKMYVLSYSTRIIYQYSLSTAFNVSTASYDSISFNLTSQDTSVFDFVFNNDGTKMYMVGLNTDSIYQYSLSTAFDVSTASYDSISFSVASQDATPIGLSLNNDGTKMYMVGLNTDSIYQYSLGTAFDISTASYDSITLTPTSQDTEPRQFRFNSDGTKMYIFGGTNDSIFQYSLSTAFDLSTASYDNISFSVASQATNGLGLNFNNDFTRAYLVTGLGVIYEYEGYIDSGYIGLETNTGTYDYVKLK